jgi:hypothetical protein
MGREGKGKKEEEEERTNLLKVLDERLNVWRMLSDVLYDDRLARSARLLRTTSTSTSFITSGSLVTSSSARRRPIVQPRLFPSIADLGRALPLVARGTTTTTSTTTGAGTSFPARRSSSSRGTRLSTVRALPGGRRARVCSVMVMSMGRSSPLSQEGCPSGSWRCGTRGWAGGVSGLRLGGFGLTGGRWWWEDHSVSRYFWLGRRAIGRLRRFLLVRVRFGLLSMKGSQERKVKRKARR